MTPFFKVGHIWAIATVAGEQHHLVIVETIGQDGRDVVGWGTGSNVLAVSSSARGPVLYQHI